MKTLNETQAKNFKQSYSCKMGGSQTLIFPNDQRFEFNDKDYYSGRGAKYNKSINHDVKGEILISKKEVAAFFKSEDDRAKIIKENIKAQKENSKRLELAKKQGIYEITENGYVELTEDEAYGRFFDAERLAKTLSINISDALLLNSEGKTYIYAKQKNGNIIELYHSDLSCNPLAIWVDFNAKEKYTEKLADRVSWVNAPYSELVGQTENLNHFVC